MGVDSTNVSLKKSMPSGLTSPGESSQSSGGSRGAPRALSGSKKGVSQHHATHNRIWRSGAVCWKVKYISNRRQPTRCATVVRIRVITLTPIGRCPPRLNNKELSDTAVKELFY